MSDVVYVSEGYITSETDNEIPQEYQTVDEIVKFWGRKKVYKVRFKRTAPKWLENDQSDAESKPKKLDQGNNKSSSESVPKKDVFSKDDKKK